LRENRLRGLTSGAVGEKSQKVTRGSHRNDVSPLTQGLRYRAACDTVSYINIGHSYTNFSTSQHSIV